MRRLALVPILVCAFLFPPGAAALGLGDIELQSALNQRLDAEIPLRGVPEDRAEDIIVTLASEQAFQDVGLQRPFSLTKLRFQVRQRAGGGYYVHVTSSETIAEPFLSFLVEVDWPGGNLLREYTVLLDPPVFASEETEPSTATADGGSAATGTGMAATGDAAEAGVPGEIDREGAGEAQAASREGDQAMTAAEAEPEASAGSREGSGDRASREGRFGDEPVFLQVEREEEEAQRRVEERQAAAREEERRRRQESAQAQPYEPEADEPAREPNATTGGTAAADAGAEPDQPDQYGPVAEGETLWNIASRLRSGDITVQQMMLALLRYNPEAFAGGNINRLRQGYVLRVPERAEVRRLSAQEAVARVGEQNALWEEWRRAQAGQETRVAQQRDEETATDGADGPAPAADDEARLSIVGSPEGGASADEQASATSASEASTSEQLRLAREQLESSEMEKQELQSRVAELEETVRKMEQLITLRENRLNELQEQLKRLQREQGGEPSDTGDTGAEDATQVAEAGAAEEEQTDAATTAVDGDGGGGTGDEAGTPEDGGDDGTELAEAEQPSDAGADAAGATGAEEGGGGTDAATSADAGAASDEAGAGAEADQASAETAETGEAATSADADAADAGEDGGAQAETAAAEETEATDPGVVTTRTQPAEKTWLDTITGLGSAIVATVGGMFASISGGGLFAGPTSPGVLGAVGLLVLALGLVLVRRRRAAGQSHAETAEAEGFETVDDQGDWTAPEEADLDNLDRGSDVIAEELGDADATRASESVDEAETALFDESFDLGSLDETSPAEQEPEEVEEPKDDTVAEADVYLAYGLHQQAEDLLRLALRESPDRADYHEKLLETLYGAGKQDDFVAEAERFRELVQSPKSRAWQRVLAMGKELAPSAVLFSTAADPGIRREELQPEKPATTDIELEAGGDSSVDFGFDDDAGASAEGGSQDFSDTMMFDTTDLEKADGDAGLAGPGDRSGAAAEETVASGTGQEDELEFDLGDLEELDAGESTAAGREPSGSGQSQGDAGTASGGEDDALEFDLSDLEDEGTAAGGEDTDESAGGGAAAAEDPEATVAATGSSEFSDFDFDFDLEQESGAPTGQAVPSPDDTGDSATPEEGSRGDDEFSLDFGDLDQGEGEDTGDSGGAESPMASGEAAPPGTAAADFAEQAPKTGETATEQGEEEDFEFDLGDLEGMPDEPDLSSSDLDSEFASSESTAGGSTADDTTVAAAGWDDSSAAAEPYEDEPSIDFDIGGLEGESPGEETADSAAEEEATAAGSDLDSSADDDEFDTMLDLAKAYIDMGDSESASDALEEVMQAGNEAQRREAKGLLETVQ